MNNNYNDQYNDQYNNQYYQDPNNYNMNNNYGYNNNYFQPPKNKKNKELIIAIAALAIVIIALIITFVLINSGKSSGNETNTGNNTSNTNTIVEPDDTLKPFENTWNCSNGSISLEISNPNFTMIYPGSSEIYGKYVINSSGKKDGYNEYILDVTAYKRIINGIEYNDTYKTQYQILMDPNNDKELGLANTVSGSIYTCLKGKANGNVKSVIVGDENYGYVTIPSNWVKFQDVEGTTSLQYSLDGQHIISIDVLNDNEHNAKEYAQTYLAKMMNDPEVTNVTGATVTVGSTVKYTAYQVYMTYPDLNKLLITYWFDTGEGRIQYIALEGPTETVDNYLSIPESFTLTK